VRLQAICFRLADQVEGLGGEIAGEEHEESHGPLDGAEDGPVIRAGVFKAAANDVFRAVRLVGLGNEAAEGGEGCGYWFREFGERADGQMANPVGDFAAVDADLAGNYKIGRSGLSPGDWN